MNGAWIGRIGSAALLAGLAVPAPAASADDGHRHVEGRWGGPVPCVPTSIDVSSGSTTCVGSSTWLGDLTGQTHYVFSGTIDLATGAGHGHIDETFIGRDAEGRTGTLRFSELVSAQPSGLPATGQAVIDARVVDGTGGFEGARGEIVFRGTVNVVAGDLGTFAGNVMRRHD